MRTGARSQILLLSLAWIAAACGSSVAGPAPADTALRDHVDQLVAPAVQAGSLAGVVVGVYDRGQRDVFAYGRARDDGGPPDARTLFEIASITKTFTAALLAGLAREGAVAL